MWQVGKLRRKARPQLEGRQQQQEQQATRGTRDVTLRARYPRAHKPLPAIATRIDTQGLLTFEEPWDDLIGERVWVFDHEGVACSSPGRVHVLAGVDHLISLAKENGLILDVLPSPGLRPHGVRSVSRHRVPLLSVCSFALVALRAACCPSAEESLTSRNSWRDETRPVLSEVLCTKQLSVC